MGGLQSTERSLSVTASKGLSALRAAPDLCCAVNQRLTSVVREICTLRSVGAGGSAPGDPVHPETRSVKAPAGVGCPLPTAWEAPFPWVAAFSLCRSCLQSAKQYCPVALLEWP